MDAVGRIMDWWRANSGRFVNLEEVLPHVVIHKVPDATDNAPQPLLLGAKSVQASIVGTADPRFYHSRLNSDWRAFAQQVVGEHRRISDSGTPDLISGYFSPDGNDANGFNFERLALPIKTMDGARLLLSYTRRVTVH
ncbi:MAG: hypothetical protein AAGC62_16555 [Pseudomonadota bacterium]